MECSYTVPNVFSFFDMLFATATENVYEHTNAHSLRARQQPSSPQTVFKPSPLRRALNTHHCSKAAPADCMTISRAIMQPRLCSDRWQDSSSLHIIAAASHLPDARPSVRKLRSSGQAPSTIRIAFAIIALGAMSTAQSPSLT